MEGRGTRSSAGITSHGIEHAFIENPSLQLTPAPPKKSTHTVPVLFLSTREQSPAQATKMAVPSLKHAGLAVSPTLSVSSSRGLKTGYWA